MKREYVAALDQGTTSSRAILFDSRGKICASAQKEFRQIYPKPGWVEHDGRDILESQFGCLREAMKKEDIQPSQIAAIGVANQRETVLLWDRFTGKPVYNAIVWQCRRTSAYCDKIEKTHGDMIYEKTGLRIDPYFSATKLKWIFDNVPFARERAEKGELLFGTIDTFLIWNLTGGKVHATDYTNASRTMLFNIHSLEWDRDLCELFGIPMCVLPQVKSSGADYGLTDKKIFGAEIPICAAVGDQQSALFGHLSEDAGTVKNTYGTGCFLLMDTGREAVRSQNGLITTLTASFGKPDYALEGSVFVGGAVVQWLRDGLGIIKSASETQELAESVPDTDGVVLVPAFVGLGAPHWDSECRGILTGITRGTTAAHIVRAALESIALQVFDVVHAMEQDMRSNINILCADGGASANGFLMQFQADILGADVACPACGETTALGAAYLAGLYAGVYRNRDSLRADAGTGKVYHPQMSAAMRTEKLRSWVEAVRRTVYRPAP